MSEPEVKEEGAPNSDTVQMAAFSDHRDELFTALDMLYIYGNASGRNKFRERWPDVAAYIFGEQLIVFDDDGTTDFDLRKNLEEEADSRRFFLKETIEDMVDKSVDSGMLQFDYVGKVVDAFGPLVSVFLYSETVIERVRPGALEQSRSALASTNIKLDEGGVSSAEKEALAGDASSENFEAVKPIDTAQPPEIVSEDLLPQEGLVDDMQHVAELSEEAVAEELSDEEASQDQSLSDFGSNPAPSVGGSLSPPPSAEAVAEAAAKVERDKLPEKPEEMAKPWDKLKKAPAAERADLESLPAAQPEEGTSVQGSNPAPAPDEPLVPLQESVKPVQDMAVSEPLTDRPAVNPPLPAVEVPQNDLVAPDASSPEAPSEVPQHQPDEVLPPQEAHPEAASQSPKPLEDTTEEQSAESKIDSVSFAGRE